MEHTSMPSLDHEWQDCPVKCSTCNYDRNVYPAKFHAFKLPRGSTIRNIHPNSNHIVFLIEGALTVHLKEDTCNIYSGQCVFLVRNTAPEIYALESSNAIMLDFSNRIMLGHYDWFSKIAAYSRHDKKKIPKLKFDANTMSVLENIMPMESPCYHLIKQYELFLSLIAGCQETELAYFFHPILRACDDFKAFVINNYKNGDSLEDIAFKANLSKSYFMRRFKEDFGMTAHQWLVEQKKEELVRMIADGQTYTKIMANTLGFNDQAGLYQFCRKHFGRSITNLMEYVYQNGATVHSNTDK